MVQYTAPSNIFNTQIEDLRKRILLSHGKLLHGCNMVESTQRFGMPITPRNYYMVWRIAPQFSWAQYVVGSKYFKVCDKEGEGPCHMNEECWWSDTKKGQGKETEDRMESEYEENRKFSWKEKTS